jgi:hypothetical protein
MPKLNQVALGSILVILSVFSVSQAASLVVNSNIALTPLTDTGILSLGQFDPSLGSLNSINWQASASVISEATVSNSSNGPVTTSINGNSTVTIADPTGPLDLASFFLNAGGTTEVSAGGSSLISGGSTENLPLTPPGTISASDLTQYVGSGIVNFPVTASFSGPSFLSNVVGTNASIQSSGSLQLTYNYTPTIGLTQQNPILPTSVSNGNFTFAGAPTSRWFDPASTGGFKYDITSPGATFTDILGFPTGFADNFTVSANGTQLGTFSAGQQFHFAGAGVTSFTISGIDPAVTEGDQTAFPLELGFSTATASFDMTPSTGSFSTPLPPAVWPSLLMLGCLGTIHISRRYTRVNV